MAHETAGQGKHRKPRSPTGRVQILGLCRFSYLGLGGFQDAPVDLAARRAYLYDPARLARRWFWFEHVTLPALARQTDPDFTLVVMTGEDLPEPYLSRLRELAELLPQLRLALLPPRPGHRAACLEAVSPHIDPDAEVVGHFRQDDDDAVSVDFVERARADFGVLRPLWTRQRRAFLDYAKGLVVQANPDGATASGRLINHATAGLLLFLPPTAGRTAVSYGHWRVEKFMPGMTLQSEPMFVRLMHHDNDSGAIGGGYDWGRRGQMDWAGTLADRFAIHLPTLDEGARGFGLGPRGRTRRAAVVKPPQTRG